MVTFVGAFVVQARMTYPGNLHLELNPGESFEGTFTFHNESNNEEAYKLSVADTIYDSELDALRDMTNEESSSIGTLLSNWVDPIDLIIKVPANESESFKFKINVPENIKPGAYFGIVRISPSIKEDSNNSAKSTQVSSTTSWAKHMSVTIPGEIERDLQLISFDLDEEEYKKGSFAFVTKFKNNGSIHETPKGVIRIYDSEDNQVLDIIKRYEDDGTVKTEDSIPFSIPGRFVFPGTEKEVVTQWRNKSIKEGDYVAKLQLIWGDDAQPMKATANIAVGGDVSISSFSTDKGWYQSGPVLFSANVNNNNQTGVIYTAKIEIKNTFGAIVETLDLTQNDGILKGNELLEAKNVEWNPDFMLGKYTAELTIVFGDNDNLITTNISFWVMTWWQIAIAVVVHDLEDKE
jgi:hypothetical protein